VQAGRGWWAINTLGVLGYSGNHNYFYYFVSAVSLSRNRLHLRLAYRENVKVELDRLKRPVLGMPITDGRKVGIAIETRYLALY
jgi:hypothetical protein